MFKFIMMTALLFPIVADASEMVIDRDCPLTIGIATFSFMKSMGLNNLKYNNTDQLVTIDIENNKGVGFESMEISCSGGRPIIGIYFGGENPRRADVQFASAIGEKIFKPWGKNVNRVELRVAINACLSTRPAEWSQSGTREGRKSTINELETWCDTMIWDNQNPKSPISTRISISVSDQM